MKVLLINKYHFTAGGAERLYFDLSELLQKNGHEVAFFSQKDDKNEKTDWSKYFIKSVSFKKENINLKNFIYLFFRMLYSFEARKKINNLLDEFKPDVVHVHGIHYSISPSILPEIKKRNIPIVMTVHDYSLLTPNINFFHKGKICEITKKRKFYKAFFHKCVKDSYIASFASALVYYIHDLLGIFKNNIDCYLAPSNFLRNKLIEYGYDKEETIYLPNFIKDIRKTGFTHSEQGVLKKSYVLYFGRLQEHKGAHLILEVAQKLPQINFLIVGDGQQKDELLETKKTKKLRNVFFLKHQPLQILYALISNSRFVVVPSLWYENQPYSIMESLALEKPVVASRIGGIPEIVKDKQNGLLFEAGNVEKLTEKTLYLWDNKSLVKSMGKNGLRRIRNNYNEINFSKNIIGLYQDLIKSKM